MLSWVRLGTPETRAFSNEFIKRHGAMRGELQHRPHRARPKKRRDGMTPSRPNSCNSLVQALRAPCCQAQRSLSGRSQRGDSAWCKTLDHLLSLLMETSI